MKKIIKKFAKPFISRKNNKYLKNYYIEVKNTQCVSEDILPENEKILVLSPHQDDESIGMGGTIVKLKENNCFVKVLYITDGRLEREGIDENEISKKRLDEADKALKILDVDDSRYISCKNLEVSNNIDRLSEEITKELQENEFTRIYTTALSEYHKDHRGCTLALAKALEKIEYNGKIYLYEINNSLQKGSINRYVEIGSEISLKKKAAFEEYKSQTGISFEVVNMIEHGKKYVSNKDIYATEVFMEISKEKLIDASKKDLSVFDNMKNATNFFRMIDNMENNKKYRENITALYN